MQLQNLQNNIYIYPLSYDTNTNLQYLQYNTITDTSLHSH